MKFWLSQQDDLIKDMLIDMGHEYVAKSKDADFVVFPGGEDVDPEYYGQQEHPNTSTHPNRDVIEKSIYEYAQSNGMKCVGICRGAQFLNVMNGGTLWQDVDGHVGDHHIYITDSKFNYFAFTRVTSTHHQMINTVGEGGNITAIAYESTWKEGVGDEGEIQGVVPDHDTSTYADIEVVIYPDTGTLCYQPHPEFSDKGSDNRNFFEALLKEILK